MIEPWTPRIDTSDGTLHERLLRAIRQDIASGALEGGTRLPPHRSLARQLGVGVGTVTRAYSEAERLGLVTSTVGRGTFVTTRGIPTAEANDDGPIDLSLNVQSLHAASARLGESLSRLQQRPDLAEILTFAPHPGIDWHRQALADWLREQANYSGIDWHRLAIVSGAQHGMSLIVDELSAPGEVVLTEPATFSGFLANAAYRGVRCEAVPMDDDGMIPEALEEAVRRFHSRVVYLQPTLHNPTTRTMPMARRVAIAEVARRHDLSIIEDDVYSPVALMATRGMTDVMPIATIAPERTWYSGSVSKALAPGLRVGMVVAPDARDFDRLCTAIRADIFATSTLSSLLVAQWITDGAASQILGEVAEESRYRLALTQRYLGDAVAPASFDTSLHAWLPMNELAAERFANTALRRGIVLTPPSSYLVDGSMVSGLRLCLNTVTREQLERALKILRAIVADEALPARNSIV